MQVMLLDEWRRSTIDAPGRSDAGPAAALLTEFRVLRFAGSDAENFLQGYLTVDTTTLAPGDGRLTALTNLKGRVVADGWCSRPEAGVVDWVIHESLIVTVAEFMRRYLAFSKTLLSEREDDHLVLGLLAPEATPGIAVVDSPATLAALLGERSPCSQAHWQAACVDAGIALVSQPVSEAFLPQMLGLVDRGAVDFDKGCYLGQEVVARAQHRGEVKRQLLKLRAEPFDAAPGAALTDHDGHEHGTLISSVRLDGSQRCLAVVRVPPADSYLCAGARLTPV